MTASDELRATLTEFARTSRMDRIPNWSARVGIRLGAVDWVTCAASSDGVVVEEAITDADSVLSISGEPALRRWLVEGVDYTNLVESGDITIHGNYFDVLLLSKALGLRPDRKIGA